VLGMTRKPYPSDVSNEEWDFVAPYLALIDEQAPQRRHSLREVFNALRWLARAGAAWRMLPNDLPPWAVVYQQFRRWDEAGCFEALVSDMRSIIRVSQGRRGQPSAVILDGRTLQSSCESGPRAGYDGYKRRNGSKVHAAVDTLGHLIALTVTPASEQERARSRCAVPAGARSHGRDGQTGLGRPRLHGRAGQRRCSGKRHRAAGSQAARGQERLCAAAQALDGRAQLCLAGQVQAPEQRF